MQDAATRIAELERELADKVEQLERQRVLLEQQHVQLQQQREQIEQLKELVSQLREQLGRNSSNSSLPPSSDSRETREKIRSNRKRGKKKRKRGGQPGHRGSTRQLLPPEQVEHITDLFPQQCENCWRPLPQVPDEHPQRYQVTELPAIKPETTEFRQHAVGCTCGHTTRAALSPEVAASPFGPRLSSIVATLTGVYHLSRRQAQKMLSDLFGIEISLGAISAIEGRVSDALAPAWQQAFDSVQEAQVKHADGTSWRQSGKALQLWVVATVLVTVFMVVADGSACTLRLVLSKLKGVLISDRAKALNFWAMKRRQICWAHLLRKFVSFFERDGPASEYGKQLLQYTGIVFEMYYAYKEAKITRKEFRRRMQPLREQFEALLQRAVDADIKGLSGSCADILYHREALWAFVDRTGIEPTNNHAEQQLRAFVLWRKRSFGTQSERGNRFAERIMTVVHTARKHNRHVLSYLTAVCEASRTGQQPPPLLAHN
jgi:transposase